jgi:hypothetical protein
MFIYFIVFTSLGYVLQRNLGDKSSSVIIILAIIWGLFSGAIWGLVSLGEMFLGLFLAESKNYS